MHTDHDHSPESIANRLSDGPKVVYLREWVYGGIDGVVTTFAIVAAVIGAQMSPLIVLILGLANLVADGFSMAASAYSAAKADEDKYSRLRDIEVSHIEKYPEGEREETRQIFQQKGFEGDELEQMVDMISQDKDIWIDFMMAEEYGVSKPQGSALKVGLHTFGAFAVCGAMPLIPFIFRIPHVDLWAFGLAGLTFFAIGSIKSLWSVKSFWIEGITTLVIGMAAAGLAYGIGFALKSFAL